MGVRCPHTIAIALLTSFLSLLVSPATASAQSLIDWTVTATFIGDGGEDIPLRVGSHDGARDGFGIRHIIDGHGEVPDDNDIDAAVGGAGDCQYTRPPNDKWRCSLNIGDRSVFVVFTERVDDNSGDGRPVGIITAYYSPRGGCPC